MIPASQPHQHASSLLTHRPEKALAAVFAVGDHQMQSLREGIPRCRQNNCTCRIPAAASVSLLGTRVGTPRVVQHTGGTAICVPGFS